MNIRKIRKDFPILDKKIHGKKLVYLDNAATSQKPIQVIDAISQFYKHHNANIHRGVHTLSEEATKAFEDAHTKASKFIGSTFEETIFTKGTTESLNLLAYSLKDKVKKGDEIVLSQMEHHSNITPWQVLAKQKGAKIKFLKINKQGALDKKQFSEVINKKTKIVSLAHMSNVLGTINPTKEIRKITAENNALFILDAAQTVPNIPVNVKKLDCDFLAFSGHKMLGPTGIGVLYGKKHLLEELPPFQTGGDMIEEVNFKESTWNKLPWKFEAGTPNIAGAVGFGAALDYLKKIGLETIQNYEHIISQKLIAEFDLLDFVELYGPKTSRGAVFAFNIKKLHSHDVATFLDEAGIAVRAGHHCAMPLTSTLGINGSVRASFYFYNTEEEVMMLISELKRIKGLLTK
ncbi:cysteine desulfurase [archaeon]|nr:cysteine desulfurase [archaeon]MBL7056667.1 cysteine desulfurase [Candidatus Woesearchaeota archaeon]